MAVTDGTGVRQVVSEILFIYRLQIQTEIWWVCKQTIFRMELHWRITGVFVYRFEWKVSGNRTMAGDWTSLWRLAGDQWMERASSGQVCSVM